MAARIGITGMGICSAAGNSIDEFAASLRNGVSGIRAQEHIFPNRTIWAGLVDGVAAEEGVDRAALLAYQAVQEAWQQVMSSEPQVNSNRVALLLGTSHGGRSQIDSCIENSGGLSNAAIANKILKVSPHFRQTEWVAQKLGIGGPVSTFSTACSSGSAAIFHGMDLLEAGKVDFVIAGGMDGFSKLTHAGFESLGAVADGACGPFSQRIGISLGEGAAVVVLERLEDADARGARIWAELWGRGSSWDCYHLTEPHPCGDGLLRALEMAAGPTGPEERGIDYANLHGTGTRANDGAETIALKRFFQSPPPASSVKSFTGHTLGASGAMGLLSAVLGMTHGFVPPTVNFEGSRLGCDLDYVPNQARTAEIRSFSTQSAGFGGVNLVLVGGARRKAVTKAVEPPGTIALTGIGVVSSAGIGCEAFRQSLLAGVSGIGRIDRFDVTGCRAQFAGLVRNFFPRKIAPTLNLRRADLCFQFAAIAVAEAMQEAKLQQSGIPAEQIGLVVGTTRGAVASFEHCMQSAAGGEWQRTSALHFPNLVMSSLGGYVSNMFQLKGAASTVVCGSGGGLQAVAHGFELLRRNPAQQAVVVVLADELSPWFYRMFDEAGECGSGDAVHVFDEASGGPILAEGAAAFVLERRTEASPGTDLSIAGYGLTFDSGQSVGRYADAMRQALAESWQHAGVESEAGMIFAHGGACRCRDAREINALSEVMNRRTPLACVLPNTGLAESASGGFSLAAAVLSLRHQEGYPVRRRMGAGDSWNFVRKPGALDKPLQSVLAVGSSRSGINAAMVLQAHKVLDSDRQTVKDLAGSSGGALDSGPVVRGYSEAHKVPDAGRQTVKDLVGSSGGALDSGPVVRGYSEGKKYSNGSDFE